MVTWPAYPSALLFSSANFLFRESSTTRAVERHQSVLRCFSIRLSTFRIINYQLAKSQEVLGKSTIRRLSPTLPLRRRHA